MTRTDIRGLFVEISARAWLIAQQGDYANPLDAVDASVLCAIGRLSRGRYSFTFTVDEVCFLITETAPWERVRRGARASLMKLAAAGILHPLSEETMQFGNANSSVASPSF